MNNTEKLLVEKYSGRVCKPLLIEWMIALTLYFGTVVLSFNHSLSLFAGSAIMCLSYFLLFNSMHASVHRHMSGNKERYIWLDKIIGRTSGFLTQISFKQFAKIHLEHHSNTNVKGVDPDYTQHKKFSGINKYVLLSYLIQVAVSFPFFGKKVLNRLPVQIQKRLKNRQDKSIIIQIRATYTILILSIIFGFGAYAFWLLLFPYLLLRYFTQIAFQWLPHISGDSSRYKNTRDLVTPLLNKISFIKLVDFHMEHHLFPSVPSTYLRKVHFEALDILNENDSIYINRFTGKPWRQKTDRELN